MNLIDDCLAPVDIDCQNRLSAEIQDLLTGNDALTRIIQADDILEIAADLVNPKNSTRFPMADDFVTRIQSRSNCKPNILSYKHIKSGVYVSVADYAIMPDRSGHAPIYQYFCKGFDENTIIGYSANEVTVKICKLSNFTESRYRALIDSLIAMVIDGMITHKARKPTTEKRLYNSVRQIVLRRFRVKAYEWALLFNADISAALMPYLPDIAQHIEKGTFYIYESEFSECKIKVYNFTAAQPERCKESPTYRPGDRLKFEITYQHQFFVRHPELTINCLTLQNTIAGLLLDHNKKHIESHLLNKLAKCSPFGLRRVFAAAGVKGRIEFMKLIDDDRTTQVSTDDRIRELKTRFDLLESVVNQNQSNQADINAQLQADIEALKDAILQKENETDKRKLRLVAK